MYRGTTRPPYARSQEWLRHFQTERAAKSEVRYGTNCRRGAWADFLPDATGVRQSAEDGGAGLDSHEDYSAGAARLLGEQFAGVAAGAEGEGAAAVAVDRAAAHGGSRGLPVLSGRKFCRRQNVRHDG